MTTYAQQQPAPGEVHPFDLEKSDFEKLLEKDFRVEELKEAQEEAKYAQSLEDHLMRSIWMARAIDRLRQLLTDDLMDLVVMPLMNTKLGFKTDRPSKNHPNPYLREEVRECVIEALIRGAFLTGNEFNIISKSAYLTKEFFSRKIREFPGLTDFVPLPGVPRGQNGGAVVPYSVSYKLNGQATNLTREIPVKVNEMMGADAIIGKADRKMWAKVYEILTGSQQSFPEGDVDDVETTYTAPGAQAVNTRLQQIMPAIENAKNGQAAAATPAAPPAPQATTPAAPPAEQPTTGRQRRTGGRPGPQPAAQQEQKPAADPPAAAAPPQPAAPTLPRGYKSNLPAGIAAIDWAVLTLEDAYATYCGLSEELRRTHWAHLTDEAQKYISGIIKAHHEKKKQEQAAPAPAPTPPVGDATSGVAERVLTSETAAPEPEDDPEGLADAGAKQAAIDEAREFVDSRSVAQLKVWFTRVTPDLLTIGREAAGVTNLSEATEQQLRKAAYAMREAQTKRK